MGDSRREGNEVAWLREEVKDLEAKLKKKKAYEKMLNKVVPQNVCESFMEVDKDGSGDIDAKALKKLALTLSLGLSLTLTLTLTPIPTRSSRRRWPLSGSRGAPRRRSPSSKSSTGPATVRSTSWSTKTS